MREWRKLIGAALRGGGRFIAPGLAGTAVLLLFSAAPAAAGEKAKKERGKDPVVESMIDAAEYICRKKCKKEHKRYKKAWKKYDKKERKLEKMKAAAGKPLPDQEKMEREVTEAWTFYEQRKAEFAECLNRCRDESPDEKKKPDMEAEAEAKVKAQGEGSGFYQENKTAVLVGGGIVAAGVGGLALAGSGNGDEEVASEVDGDGAGPTADEISGTYALSGNRSSGDCPGFRPTISNPAVTVVGANGMVSFFSSAEIRGALGADGSYRGEGSYLVGECTIIETIQGRFTKDPSGRIIFTGTLTFDDRCGCIVSYSVTYTRQ